MSRGRVFGILTGIASVWLLERAGGNRTNRVACSRRVEGR